MSLSEAERYLLEQVRAGRAEGWQQLVGRYQGRLLSFARSYLRQHADAEDAVQETFLGFLRGLDRYREDTSLESYLFTILRRRMVDRLRRKRLAACSLPEGSPDASGRAAELAGDEPTASWHARRDEAQHQLTALLGRVLLDVTQRLRETCNFEHLQVAELLFYAQMPNKEIAERLDIGASQVGLLKHRFLKRIASGVAAAGDRELAKSAEAEFFAREALLTQVWEQLRPSCPKRSTIGHYLLGAVEPAWQDFLHFHLETLGCRFCRANLEDLQAETAGDVDAGAQARILQSTVGFLRRPGG
ncbi:MAG: RNA polymerase sigma factor [Phycisphaeraceae bacterium]